MTTSNDTLWVAASAYDQILELGQRQAPRETGGMLLGYEANDGSAVVTKIIGPGPEARHGRFRFTPDGKYQQSSLEEHYWATDGRETYLGDWHTHPLGDSTPSTLDRRTLARIANERLSGTKHPLMAILAGGSGRWNLGAVRLITTSRRFIWLDCQVRALNPVFF